MKNHNRKSYCLDDKGSICTVHSYKLGRMGVLPGQMLHAWVAQDKIKRFDEANPNFVPTPIPDPMWEDWMELHEIMDTNYESPLLMFTALDRLKHRGNLKKGDYVVNIPFKI